MSDDTVESPESAGADRAVPAVSAKLLAARRNLDTLRRSQGAQATLAIRILLADDSAPWARFISSIIVKHTDWHIVAEAADGFEAVQKAGELKPDLILLDIGLPQLNGIEAARQIGKLVPQSKILFVSALDDPDIVREGLRTGARGYLVKSDAGSEFTEAIETVLRGERFISRKLKERNSAPWLKFC